MNRLPSIDELLSHKQTPQFLGSQLSFRERLESEKRSEHIKQEQQQTDLYQNAVIQSKAIINKKVEQDLKQSEEELLKAQSVQEFRKQIDEEQKRERNKKMKQIQKEQPARDKDNFQIPKKKTIRKQRTQVVSQHKQDVNQIRGQYD